MKYMKTRIRMLFALGLIGTAAFALAACGGDADQEPTSAVAEPAAEEPAAAEEPQAEEPELVLIGDSIRGGLLYDKWWTVLAVDAPEDDHPLWATQDSNARSGSDTWRCKECHGWDYKGVDGAYGSGSHLTGFTGVISSMDMMPAEVWTWLDGTNNPDHDFSQVMDEQAITDMVLFLTEELVDDDTLVAEDKTSLGVASGGEQLFQDSCSDCHGAQGNGFNFSSDADPEYLGGLSGGNPWEFVHKLRFGQPSESEMPSAIDDGWTQDEMADVLAYVQTLPTSSPVTEGGRMYDKWWNALGTDAPEGDMPLWATQTTNERDGDDTWRCKECHGWDYRGVDGAYGSGSHSTGFTGILGAASSASAEELLAWLNGSNNSEHDFSPFMEEAQMQTLVTFMQEGASDVSAFINDDKTVNGDPEAGQGTYSSFCTRCHGEDGDEIIFGDESSPEYIADIANDNPWEFFHKALYGQPGEPMVSMHVFDLTMQDIADLAAYAQTLSVGGE